MKRVLIASLLMGLATLRLGASQHPVMLDPNVGAAKCLECHADKAKGKSAHATEKVNCLSCHEVRVSKTVTRVKLVTPSPSTLCFTCHKDKNTASLTGRIHPPDARDCQKCHDPHTSANPALLLKPMSGGQAENLCLACHDVGIHVAKGGSRHAALDSGCDACHTIHKTGDPNELEFGYHLSKTIPLLCFDCHDPKEEKIRKAHHDQPFEKSDCIQCHDARQSSSPKLMQAFLHNPFENKECDDCHQAPKDGKVVLTQKDVKSTCAVCHEEQAKQIASAKVQHPGAQEDCTVCHNPHGGMTPGFLQPNPTAACLACHSEKAEQFKKKHLHQPATDLGCATCHEPHGGNNAHLLRIANVNALCLECHGAEANPPKVEGTQLVAIFNGKVKIPDTYFRRVVRLPLKYGRGHPVEHHPVVDQMDPTDVTKVRVALNCLSCHQPHASSQPDLLVGDMANGAAFCARCHKDLGR